MFNLFTVSIIFKVCQLQAKWLYNDDRTERSQNIFKMFINLKHK